jgi:hypothetical protein
VFTDVTGIPEPSRGPWAAYQKGIQHGRIRPDERQLKPMKILQELYVQLEKLYPARAKPSNLTILESVERKDTRSWCDPNMFVGYMIDVSVKFP